MIVAPENQAAALEIDHLLDSFAQQDWFLTNPGHLSTCQESFPFAHTFSPSQSASGNALLTTDPDRDLPGDADLRAALDLVLSAAIPLLGADMGVIHLLAPDGKTLEMLTHCGLEAKYAETFRRLPIEDGHPEVLSLRSLRQVATAAGYSSLQSIPIPDPAGNLVGVLSTYSRSVQRSVQHPDATQLRRVECHARLAGAFIAAASIGAAVKTTSRAIATSETARLHEALNSAGTSIWEIDFSTGRLQWDDRACCLLGIPPGTQEPFGVAMSHVAEEDRPRVVDRLAEIIRHSATDRWEVEFRIIAAAGELAWLHVAGKGRYDRSGNVISACGIALSTEAPHRTDTLLADIPREYRDMIDNSRDGIARVDLTGHYLFANKRLAEMGGCRPEDFKGQSIGTLTTSLPARWILYQVIVNRKAEIHEYARAGFHVSIKFIPEIGPDNKVRSVLLVATDITEHEAAAKLARERGALIEMLFDAAAHGIIAVDSTGAIRLANSVAERMFGYSETELTDRCVDELLPESSREIHARHRAGLFAAYPSKKPMGEGLDLRGRRKDGSVFPVEISLSSVQTESGPLAVSFITDMTARRQQEEELRELRAAVATAQDDFGREIAGELHDGVNQKLAFLSMSIGKDASEHRADDPLAAKLRSYQEKIHGVSEDIRQVSRRMHPCVLDDLGLCAAIEELSLDATFAGLTRIDLDLGTLPEPLDRRIASALYRICQESLSNVMRHSNADRAIIKLECEDNMLRLSITDSGGGFDVKKARRSGLGLHSIKERARLINGHAEIESEPGRGSRVSVVVPLAVSRPPVNPA